MLNQSGEKNIIFILADDLGWSDLGCYGNNLIETPYIDALAKSGMMFTQAYAAAPVCTPTRVSILSGQFPVRTGVYDTPFKLNMRPWAKLIPPDIWSSTLTGSTTLGKVLAQAGYISAHIGKIHEPIGFRDGFTYVSPHNPYIQGRVPVFSSVDRKNNLSELLGNELWNDVMAYSASNPSKCVGTITEETIRFISENRNRKFFCFTAHHAPHIPLDARNELNQKYENKFKEMGAGDDIHPHYAASCQTLDESVGLIQRTLERLNIIDNTIIIFTSDNGGVVKAFSDKKGPNITTNSPLRHEKGSLYEGGIRVPQIVLWPGVTPPGSICNTPIISIDWLPTIADMSDTRIKKGTMIDGVSFKSLLGVTYDKDKQMSNDEHNCIKSRFFWYYPAYHHTTPVVAMRDGKYKLIKNLEDNKIELYDLIEDIGEQNDISKSKPEISTKLQTILDSWLKDTKAKSPINNPEYDKVKEEILAGTDGERAGYIPLIWR